MKWITCESCEEEFRVISDNDTPIAYCPFCSEPINSDEDSDEDDYE